MVEEFAVSNRVLYRTVAVSISHLIHGIMIGEGIRFGDGVVMGDGIVLGDESWSATASCRRRHHGWRQFRGWQFSRKHAAWF